MDHKAFLASVPAETRQALTQTDDRHGLWHLAGHAALIGVLQAYVAVGWPFWGLALVPLGITLAFLFTLQHECTHRTPFRSVWLNEVVGHVTGVILFQPFLWFRAFHLAHHRFTNDPDHDPELNEGKPETWQAFLWHLATPGYWLGKLKVLYRNAAGQPEAPYVTDRLRPILRREARFLIAAYAAVAAFTALVSSILIWIWLLPLVLGFPALRLYLLAEHGRCPAVADMFDNSRTTLTNRAVRFLAWNMPYHAEHHAWPTVPFHRLPELHLLTQSHLKRVSRGYIRVSQEILRHE